jgi:hypothetical protein
MLWGPAKEQSGSRLLPLIPLICLRLYPLKLPLPVLRTWKICMAPETLAASRWNPNTEATTASLLSGIATGPRGAGSVQPYRLKCPFSFLIFSACHAPTRFIMVSKEYLVSIRYLCYTKWNQGN